MSQLSEPIRRLPKPLRIVVVALVCLALAIPALAAVGASPAPGTGPTGATAATSAPGATEKPDANGEHDGGRGHGFGAFRGGPRGFGGGPGGHITITAIDGSRITLATDDGWTRTIDLGAGSAVTRGDAKLALTDLKVGDEVRIRETRNADGSFTIVELRIVVPHLGGTVTVVGDTSLTLKLRDGTARVVTLAAGTTYQLGARAGTKADVAVGADVDIEGTPGAADAFTAITVHVRLPRLHGTVTALSASTITITTRGKGGAATATIHVGAGTGFVAPFYKGLAPATGGVVAIGAHIWAEGTLRPDGSLDATSIYVRPPHDSAGTSPAP